MGTAFNAFFCLIHQRTSPKGLPGWFANRPYGKRGCVRRRGAPACARCERYISNLNGEHTPVLPYEKIDASTRPQYRRNCLGGSSQESTGMLRTAHMGNVTVYCVGARAEGGVDLP